MLRTAHTESATERPLGLRMRGDLVMVPQRFGGERYWAVKDPVALKYFHLREQEYTVLTMLDGQASLEDIRRRCEAAWAPQHVSAEQLHALLATLHRHGLLLAESAGQGEQLRLRHEDERRRRRYESIASALAIRFRGVNPRRLLDWLEPKCCWLFSPAFVIGSCLLALSAVLLVSVEFETFRSRLPNFDAIVGAANLPWLVVTLAVIKILHELGHALACRRFGSDCHEIGFMLLVFTPCLYCNVSDSWMLASKWRRIAIAAAGMYVELILASACTFLWWFSQPGLFNSLCLNTVLVCSLGTLLLNGNPLLRYDGYYILSDLVEVPNLSARATAAVQRLAGRWCLGLDLASDPTLTPLRQFFLILYAVAAFVYRCIVVVAVLWGLHRILAPYHLDPLVVLLACLTLAAMVAPAVLSAARAARDPSLPRRVVPLRVAFAGGILSLGLAALALVPMPMRVAAPLVLEYRDAQRVYVPVPGTLVSSASVGQAVQNGHEIAKLTNDGMAIDLARLTSQRNELELRLKNLESRRLQGDIDGSEIPAAKAALADAGQRLEELQRDAARLTMIAPAAGTVLPPPVVPRKTRSAEKLDRWAGIPLDERNRGTFLDCGTLVCLVGDPQAFEAVLHVQQTDVELVQAGQRVKIALDHLPGQTFWGTLTDVAKLDLDVMPPELAAAGDLPSRTDRRGVAHPLDTWYQARVVFDEPPPHAVARVHGTAKIIVTSQSLAAQLWRFLSQTFGR